MHIAGSLIIRTPRQPQSSTIGLGSSGASTILPLAVR
jgi:hypothetical protein